jgi:excisionase family DNA binding protein
MYDYEFDDIISVDELQEVLKIGKSTTYQLLNSGKIKAFRVGRVWKIPKTLLNEFIIQSAVNNNKY